MLQMSLQLRQPLLCKLCEQRFNNGGERWMAVNCARSTAKSKIQNALETATPFHISGPVRVYSCHSIPEVDANRIIYFATSVFWRAAVAPWDGQPLLDLGPYERQFADYLLSLSQFPRSGGLVVTVNDQATTKLSMIAPHGKTGPGFHQYSFFIPGLTFDLFVGGKLPSLLDRSCIVRGPGQPIFLSDKFRETVAAAHVELLE